MTDKKEESLSRDFIEGGKTGCSGCAGCLLYAVGVFCAIFFIIRCIKTSLEILS